MNIISTDVEWAKGYGAGSWRAYARINGKRTSINCMHSHTREDLAAKCAAKKFTPAVMKLVNAVITELDDNLYEMTWTDDKGRSVMRRFYYLKEETND